MADTKILPDVDDCADEGGKRGKRGRRGHDGHDGATGATGATGPSGAPTGATGATGAAGASAIIPFASGDPVELAHVIGGLADPGGLIGFGASLDSVSVGGGTIDLTGTVGVPTNMAFSMPRAGTLTQLSVYYSNVIGVEDLPAGVTVIVQLYRSTTPNNIFTPILGALVTLAIPAGLLVLGAIANGTTALSVAVSNQDRLLLVARVTVTGTDDVVSLTGYVSAGLAIA